MDRKKRFFVLAMMVLFFITTAGVVSAKKPVADEVKGPNGISWCPNIDYPRIVLRVARPDGEVISKTFEVGSTPYFDLSNTFGNRFPDGSYTYELRATPAGVNDKGLRDFSNRDLTQTGYFVIQGGMIVTGAAPERVVPTLDYTNGGTPTPCTCPNFVPDPVCIGCNEPPEATLDCDNNSYIPTLQLREEGPRLLFQDTTTAPNSPTNDWQIVINDIGGGTGEYFAIQDVDGCTFPFTIEAGAWDNSVYITDDGKVGVGTSTPSFALEVYKQTGHSVVNVVRENGATAVVAGRGTNTAFGSRTHHRVQFVIDNLPKMNLEVNGYLSLGDFMATHPLHLISGAHCTAGGVWTNASSREYKENIKSLTADEAMETLEGLNPVKYNYKVDKDEKHVGFIAEEAPEMVASKDRKGMSAMDVVAVLTKVVQEQQKTISQLKKEIAELKNKVNNH